MQVPKLPEICARMFAHLIFFSAIIFTVGAVDVKSVLLKYPELQKCISTYKMFDASAKLPAGIMVGNLIEIGNFDQCLAIDEVNEKSKIIKGKYCLVKITLPSMMKEAETRSLHEVFENNFLDFPEIDKNSSEIEERMIVQGADPLNPSLGLMLGWCVPHTCPISDLTSVLSIVIKEINSDMEVIPIVDGMCQTKDDLQVEYNTNNIIFIIFLVATLFLMILSTTYDVYIQHKEKKPAHIILIAFSVLTNGRKLLAVSNHPDQLSCLNGIRVLSMMWVLYGHKAATIASGALVNAAYLDDWMHNPANMYLLNATVSVDSFFLLSGLLVGYGYCLSMAKGAKFNIILYYVHRYLRLTPALAVIIWFHVTIFGYFGSGPFWPYVVNSLKQPCDEGWWTTLIYIQNYYDDGTVTCILQSWYLAIDMQLFILSPIILIPLWKWPKHTMMASAVLVLGSMASSFAVTYVNDLVANPDLTTFRYYFATHTRYGPWLMGLMLGYYLFKVNKNKNSRIALHPAQIVLGWIVALGLLISTVYASYDLQFNPEILAQSFLNGFNRHGWSLGLCWVIYACTQGYGGPIDTFLSWSVFQVLGRFTYCIYLVHMTLQQGIAGSIKTNSYFSDFGMLYVFWGDFMMSLMISVCLTLAYESPMVTIEKVLFKKEHKPVKSANPTTSGDEQAKVV